MSPFLPYTEETALLMNSGDYNGLGIRSPGKILALSLGDGFGKPPLPSG